MHRHNFGRESWYIYLSVCVLADAYPTYHYYGKGQGRVRVHNSTHSESKTVSQSMSFTVFHSHFCSCLCFAKALWVISFFLINLYLSGTQRVFTKSRGVFYMNVSYFATCWTFCTILSYKHINAWVYVYSCVNSIQCVHRGLKERIARLCECGQISQLVD